MSRVRNKDTDLEIRVRSELHRRGHRFRKNYRELPGSPDVVFTKTRVAVFINGDFWHGRQFNLLKRKLAPFWQEKIYKNRMRDASNYRQLRKLGWTVIVLWKYQILQDLNQCVLRVEKAVMQEQLSPNR